jgi:hypothetical protein
MESPVASVSCLITSVANTSYSLLLFLTFTMSNLLQTGPGKVQPLFNAPRLTRLRPTNAKVSMKQEQGHEEVQEVQAAEVKSE